MFPGTAMGPIKTAMFRHQERQAVHFNYIILLMQKKKKKKDCS